MGDNMAHVSYWPEDDILKVRLSDKSITRETSKNWNVHKGFAEDGELVEVVFLDAVQEGYFDPAADGQQVA